MKVAVFYHLASGLDALPDKPQAWRIIIEQLAALKNSGLEARADEIHLGVVGPDFLEAATVAPSKSVIHHFGNRTDGERPTLELLDNFCEEHPDWGVCYHHTKGVCHPRDAAALWRRCMEYAVIWNWRRCIYALESGYDSAGAHWLTPRRYSMLGMAQRFWGGNFWWATAQYINQLPEPIKSPGVNGRYYDGEAWIGLAKRAPKVMDFAPHWPLKGCR